MMRYDWEFTYSAETLAIAAIDQRDLSALRMDEWSAKQAEAKTDDARAKCAGRIHYHRKLRDEYAVWAQVLEAHKEQTMKLHCDDYLFFFGRQADGITHQDDTDAEETFG